VNCYIKISGSSCLGSDVGGVRAGVEDGLATSDEIVLGTGVLFLFSHKRVELLLFSPSVFVFIKDISSALSLLLYLVSENYSSFSSSTNRLGDCDGVSTVRVDTVVFRVAVFLLLSSSTIHLGCTVLLTVVAIVLCICNGFHVVGLVYSTMLVPF
jgi:hypothetical protein